MLALVWELDSWSFEGLVYRDGEKGHLSSLNGVAEICYISIGFPIIGEVTI